MLFDCLPESLLVAVGTMEPVCGWSGIELRYMSNATLKASQYFLISLIFFGKQLKSLLPLTWKLLYLNICTDRPFLLRLGTLTLLPSLVSSSVLSTPQFGAIYIYYSITFLPPFLRIHPEGKG